ncbi:MAG: nucleotidyltransferase family protein [Polyangiales bacterium]
MYTGLEEIAEVPQTTGDRMGARRRAATSLAATALVEDVARKLAPSGISVMPVKGALLQHWLYEDPTERPLSDVDLLVRPDELKRAVKQLESSGYRSIGRSSFGAVVLQSPFGLALDLHPSLFDRARYRLPTQELFARSIDDTSLYSFGVRLPSPLDAYAHLIGKFGSDHLDARARARLDEIARMARRIDAPPNTVARHLVHCGMRRVSRYVLPLVHQATGEPFALQVLDCLPFDPIGQGIAAIAYLGLRDAPALSRSGALTAHLLNDSLPRGAHSGIRALFQRVPCRLTLG